MKRVYFYIVAILLVLVFTNEDCQDSKVSKNHTAFDEQVETEKNQQNLFTVQPPPKISWSLERDNLIKRFKLQNDRTVNFFMYVFIEGNPDPIGYYQVNKVSSVNSQLTNTEQVVNPDSYHGDYLALPSPAEDGSYGTNGDAVFGFTPEDIYIETNCKYIVSTVPLQFAKPVVRLAVVNTDEIRAMLEVSKKAMNSK